MCSGLFDLFRFTIGRCLCFDSVKKLKICSVPEDQWQESGKLAPGEFSQKDTLNLIKEILY